MELGTCVNDAEVIMEIPVFISNEERRDTYKSIQVIKDLSDNHQQYQIEIHHTNEIQPEQIHEIPQIDNVDSIFENNFILENEEDNFFKWTSKAIRLLIALRLAKEPDFENPLVLKNRLKKRLWMKVAEEMRKCGYNVTGSLCDSKYRNLLHTYRTNKAKVKYTEGEECRWEYFDQFEQVIGHKPFRAPPQRKTNYIPKFKNNQQDKNNANRKSRKILRTSDFTWSPKSTKLLIDLRASLDNEFDNPSWHKKKIWEKIANQMKDFGYDVNGAMCDARFRSILFTYRINKRKLLSANAEPCTWQYFEQFDRHFGHKFLLNEESEHIFTNKNDNDKNCTTNNDKNEPIPIKMENDAVNNNKLMTMSSKNKIELYFNKKLKFEKQKWKEKKILYQQRTEAILELAKALGNVNKCINDI